jgi:hypothetical protein
MTERWVRTDMSETTDRGLHYYVLPDGPVAAVNVLREAAGLRPWREDGEEVGGDGAREAGRGAMSCEKWVAHHRCQGHNPHPAPTIENPERWECRCDPEAVWTAVWRIVTPEQVRQKFAHLSKRPNPAREAQRRDCGRTSPRFRQRRRNAMPLCTTSTTVTSRPCVSPTDTRPVDLGPR